MSTKTYINQKREVLSRILKGAIDGVINAKEAARNYTSAAVGNIKTGLNKQKIGMRMSRDLPIYVKKEAQTELSKRVKSGNFAGAKSYVKGQLEKLATQTRDVPTSNEWVRNKLKKYKNI